MSDARGRRRLVEGGVLLAYLLAAVIYTFPLVTRFLTRFPGGSRDKDVFAFVWDNWWIWYSLTVLHAKPYLTGYLWAPFVVDLRFHALGLLYGLLCLPAISLLGPVGVLNLQVLATAVLNGYATFRLTRHLTASDGAGFVSGLLVTVIPAIDFHLTVGRPSYAALWPAIFAMYFFLKLVDEPRRRGAVWLGVFLCAMLMADQQAAIYGAMWLAILALGAAISRRRDLVRALPLLVAAVAAGTVVPGYLLYVRPLMRTLGYTVPGPDEAFNYSYPLSLFWTPKMFWPVYGVVLPAGLLAGLALVRRIPPLVPWLAGALFFLVLSLGPVVSGTHIPLPFALLTKLPGLAQFRTPYRFQIPAALGLAVTVGIAISWLLPKLGPKVRRLVFGAVLIAITGDLLAYRLVDGFATQGRTHDVVYEEIGRDGRDRLLLEIPVGVRCGTDRVGVGEELTFHQPVHRKRLINGLVARVPYAALEYYRTSPALMFLATETPPPGDIAADLRRRLVDLDVGYVVVHPEMIEKERLARIIDLLGSIEGLTPMRSSTGLLAFRR